MVRACNAGGEEWPGSKEGWGRVEELVHDEEACDELSSERLSRCRPIRGDDEAED